MNQHLLNDIEMSNMIVANESLLLGGQPSEADFERFDQLGIKQVVIIRPPSETLPFDEKATADQYAMNYIVIPLSGIDTFTREAAQQLSDSLALEQPTLVHCASGNRVGALFALKAFWLDGESAQDAYQLGLQMGLTKLAPDVEKMLGL